MQLMRRPHGFTLTELAVVLVLVGLLIGGAIMTFSAQVEQRTREETLRRLNAAAESIVAFAIVNKRLPCPARFTSAGSHSQGQESFCVTATGTCAGSETTTVQAHGNCSNFYDGFVPAASIALQPVDSSGFAVDTWGNRLRYAIARDNTGCSPTPPANTRIWTSQANLKSYGVSCRPNDLDLCAPTDTTTACTAANRVVSTQTVGFVVYSSGKNGALPAASQGPHEQANTDGNAAFISRTPSGSDSGQGLYDDVIVYVPVGVVYSKLVAAGVLP
jgi:prepilin-type N-terminal cleavage/methylation domain-containing protein